MSTRPLLYIFLQARSGQSDSSIMHWLESESVSGLLHICIESSQQVVRILYFLLDQGLLGWCAANSHHFFTSRLRHASVETFLPFDLDAAFTSTISILMAAGIDPSLINDHTAWTTRAYSILEEIRSRGNIIAGMVKSELEQLGHHLHQLSTNETQGNLHCLGSTHNMSIIATESMDEARNGFMEVFQLHDSLSAEQLVHIADSLEDINSFPWPAINSTL